MRGFILSLCVLGVHMSLGGCGQGQSSKVTTYVPAEQLERYFHYNCQDNLTLIEYAQAHHVSANKSEKLSKLKDSISKIISKGFIPTPYFLDNINQDAFKIGVNTEGQVVEVTPPWLINYVKFSGLGVGIGDLGSNESFCATVSAVSSMIEEKMDEQSKQHLNLEKIKALLHKGIFRYFLASLDPHSFILESKEKWYNENGLQAKLKRDIDENKTVNYFGSGSSKPNVIEKKLPIVGYWLKESSVMLFEIEHFDDLTADVFSILISNLQKEKNPKAIIIDLRNNRGGKAYEVNELADLFLKEGYMLSMRQKQNDQWTFENHSAKAGNEISGIKDIPVILLVSSESASSAEIFTSIMQENNAAVVIGSKTFGKGTGQSGAPVIALVSHIYSAAHLNLTSHFTFSPSGMSLQLQGVTPDILVTDLSANAVGTREASFSHAIATPLQFELNKNYVRPHNALTDQWRDSLTKHFQSTNNFFSLESLLRALQD